MDSRYIIMWVSLCTVSQKVGYWTFCYKFTIFSGQRACRWKNRSWFRHVQPNRVPRKVSPADLQRMSNSNATFSGLCGSLYGVLRRLKVHWVQRDNLWPAHAPYCEIWTLRRYLGLLTYFLNRKFMRGPHIFTQQGSDLVLWKNIWKSTEIFFVTHLFQSWLGLYLTR